MDSVVLENQFKSFYTDPEQDRVEFLKTVRGGAESLVAWQGIPPLPGTRPGAMKRTPLQSDLPALFAKACLAYCIATIENNTKAAQAVQQVIQRLGTLSGQLVTLEQTTNDIDIPSLDEKNDPKFRRGQMLILQAANMLESAIRQFELLPEV